MTNVETLIDLVKKFIEAAEDDGHAVTTRDGSCLLCNILGPAKLIVATIELGEVLDYETTTNQD
jgi:hypothetical protein